MVPGRRRMPSEFHENRSATTSIATTKESGCASSRQARSSRRCELLICRRPRSWIAPMLSVFWLTFAANESRARRERGSTMARYERLSEGMCAPGRKLRGGGRFQTVPPHVT
jgi:hypothetical protein